MPSQLWSVPEGIAPPLWYPHRYNFGWELGGHCTHDRFYMHQVPLAYMAVFARRASNSGSPVLYRLSDCGPCCNEIIELRLFYVIKDMHIIICYKFFNSNLIHLNALSLNFTQFWSVSLISVILLIFFNNLQNILVVIFTFCGIYKIST